MRRITVDLSATPVEDRAVVARAIALGQMVMAAAHAEHLLGGLLVAALSQDSNRAGYLVVGESFEWRRARLHALAQQTLPPGPPREHLLGVLDLLQRMMRRRNLAVHGMHGEHGVTKLSKRNWFQDDLPLEPLTTAELNDLALGFGEAVDQLLGVWDALHVAGLLFFPRAVLDEID
jgi:hypothetical protein